MKKQIKKILSILIVIIVTFIFQTTDNINVNKKIYNEYNEVVPNNFTKAYVSRVVDGDTIEVFINSEKYKVRLIGINCPEYTNKTEYFGKEASEYTTSQLTYKEVYLEKDVSETDKYGRLLRYVWTELPSAINEDEIKSKMFNAILLNNGYAMQATYPPDIKYVDIFKEIAADARDNFRGLW